MITTREGDAADPAGAPAKFRTGAASFMSGGASPRLMAVVRSSDQSTALAAEGSSGLPVRF